MMMKNALPSLLLVAAAGSLHAQTPTAGVSEPEDKIVLGELIAQGGIMMFPLGALALIGIILIILYLLTIRRGSVVTNRYMYNADDYLRKRDLNGLLNYSQRRSEMVARLTQRTLQFVSETPQASALEVREVAETEGSRQANILSQRINWLGDIGAIAPMVGLLGTVIGMIKSFTQISRGEVGVLQQMLASGVSEALVTTAAGLVIGITAITFHSFFKGRVNRLLSEFEAASTHVITLLTSQLGSAPASGLNQPPQQMPMPGTAEADLRPTHQVTYPQ